MELKRAFEFNLLFKDCVQLINEKEGEFINDVRNDITEKPFIVNSVCHIVNKLCITSSLSPLYPSQSLSLAQKVESVCFLSALSRTSDPYPRSLSLEVLPSLRCAV
jgi:hypothetical protein